jgi:gas vesicle protein
MRNKCTYCLMGFGCGSLAALLFAPKAGASTRAGILRAGKKRRRLLKQKMASTVAAIEQCRIGTWRALKGRTPAQRVRALFQ